MTWRRLPPFPSGWYVLGAAHDLRPGAIWRRELGGRKLVVFRTEAGEVAALDAYCPHLGAHLGHGGRVEKDAVRCPFHGLRFGTDGRCKATGYPGEPAFRRRITSWPVRERNGFVLVYFHEAREAPDYEVPELDVRGWTPVRTRTLELKAHPQETSENSVDLAHFSSVHGYEEAELLGEVEVEGARLRTRYAARRRFPFLPKRLSEPLSLRIEIEVELWGLGYSLVRIHVPRFSTVVRLWVLSSHTDGEHVALTLATSAEWRPSGHRDGWKRLLPWSLVARALRRFILSQTVHDVLQDEAIWAHKVHVDPPALVKGDGPIAAYRRYARQFYPPTRALRGGRSPSPEDRGPRIGRPEVDLPAA